MRPTGKLHLGNYMGALFNWVKLQHDYECYFFIADYHALTTDYANTSNLRENIREVILDFLAAGLDPEISTLFIQSDVKAHFELHALFSMITPLSWLERVPTYKDQQEQLKEKDLATYGFLGYPLLQSADILLYKPRYVPVGADQVAHVELTREIARRFNQFFPGDFHLASDAAPWEMGAIQEKARKLAGDKAKSAFSAHELYEAAHQTKKITEGFGRTEVLPEPDVLLTPSPKLPGTDGRKMSKSYRNTILLSDPESEVRTKLKTMVTDPARVRREDPGNPDVCPVFDLHKVFSSEETQQEARIGCTTAGIGCIQCKSWLADAVVAHLAPIQERRRYYESNFVEVEEILRQGAVRAAARANQTMQEVRYAVGLSSL
ncbi:tryptophan--tRNA ligase [Edaphobacter sp. HDX4]|uniref:tryptophan--tRNA ligase n=1 Tax=Edaphobacter sp. HDX4 TaxID=2794064 RepID=UPI003FA54CE2